MIIHMKSATFRYRAGRIVHVFESSDLSDGKRTEPSVMVDDVKEFRTLKAAKKYQSKLPGNTFLQFGVLQWASGEEASKVLFDLQSNGARLE